MSVSLILILISMWLFVAAQVYFEYRHHQGHSGPYVGITKTLGSMLFVAAGLSGGVHPLRGGGFLMGGIVLCAVGDIFLIFQQRRLFLIGIGAFLLAHLAYCGAFISMKGDIRITVAVAPFVYGVGFLIARWLLPHVEDKMKKPVIAYLVTICTMVALASGLLLRGGGQFTVAAAIFMISDVYVARHRFVKSEFKNRLIGLPLYYIAQMIFATAASIAPFFEIV
ncbi:MAG: lysoplasmalogenase [Deltaproteobacteria bacterium]|nr:lysoplasmalogenase [Deltaproteobacteria bacterium]